MTRTFSFAVLMTIAAAATPAAADNWMGLYFGGTVGLGRMATDHSGFSQSQSDFDAVNTGSIGWPPHTQTVTLSSQDTFSRADWQGSDDGDVGASGGVLLGGNYRIGSFVLGSEINMDWLDYTSEAAINYESVFTSRFVAVRSENGGPFLPLQDDTQTNTSSFQYDRTVHIDWKATILGRAGILVSDNLLAYGLIGYSRAGFTDAPFDTRNGVTFGGGFDLALNNGWALRAEYRRTEFEKWKEGQSTTEFFSGPTFTQVITTSYGERFQASTDELKLGLTYRFFSVTP